MLERCDVRAARYSAPVRTLSGGNQQKVLLARTLLCGPRVLVADEPTRGVDVGAKRAIYDFLTELAADGLGVIVISSELEELLGLAHRILVMRRGRIAGEFVGEQMTESALLNAAFADESARRGRSMSTNASAIRAGRVYTTTTSFVRNAGILIPFLILFAVLSFSSSSFATKPNLLNILEQQSATLIIASAGTLVLVAGGIDLSVGATYGFAGVTSAHFAQHTTPSVAIALGIGAGLLIGLVNGLATTLLRVNALITTLAMSFIVSGCAALVTKGNLLVLFDKPGFGKLANTVFLGIKTSIWLMVVTVIVMGLVLSATTAGRYMYAVGGNAEAARLAGVRVDAIRVLTFVLSGGAAGLAGVIDTSRVLSAQASSGDTALAFTVLAGIVVGGTSILGGEGAVWRTVVGVLFIALIGNGYILLGLDPLYEQITMGALLLAAVALDSWTRGRLR